MSKFGPKPVSDAVYLERMKKRFAKYVNTSGATPDAATYGMIGQCHEWTGTLVSGYGVLHRRGRVAKAHRLAWEFANGPIPDELYVLHRCDNRACVRVEHLELGTARDNSDQKYERGRARQCSGAEWHAVGRPMRPPRGEASPHSKLTEEAVTDIWRSSDPSAVIGARYGVSSAAVEAIRRGRNWREFTATLGPRFPLHGGPKHLIAAIRESNETDAELSARLRIGVRRIRAIRKQPHDS